MDDDFGGGGSTPPPPPQMTSTTDVGREIYRQRYEEYRQAALARQKRQSRPPNTTLLVVSPLGAGIEQSTRK